MMMNIIALQKVFFSVHFRTEFKYLICQMLGYALTTHLPEELIAHALHFAYTNQDISWLEGPQVGSVTGQTKRRKISKTPTHPKKFEVNSNILE